MTRSRNIGREKKEGKIMDNFDQNQGKNQEFEKLLEQRRNRRLEEIEGRRTRRYTFTLYA